MSATTALSYNRGPITSFYTQPTSCSSVSYLVATASELITSGFFINIWDGAVTVANDCYPPGSQVPTTLTITELTSGGPPPGTYMAFSLSFEWDYYYYSPAVCPAGWTTASSLTSILNGPSMAEGTSGYLCCPELVMAEHL
jgi:hypothetical protein